MGAEAKELNSRVTKEHLLMPTSSYGLSILGLASLLNSIGKIFLVRVQEKKTLLLLLRYIFTLSVKVKIRLT